jgi:nucleotide-binding universal stress UspA family protein
MSSLKTILVPTDFDDPTEAPLKQALRLAKARGARIKRHVLPFALTDVADDLFYASPNAAVRRRTSALKRLADIAGEHEGDGVPIEVELREGIAWDEIVGAARQLEADLVVIGTRGKGAVARGLLGSVAERVVRASTVPVMTVRASISHDERGEFGVRA